MKQDTKLVHLAREKPKVEGTVNQPVYRASTIISPDMDSYIERHAGDRRYENVTYGATGTHNAKTLADAVADLEGGHKAIVTASGLSAVTLAISALVGAGDHVLVTDSVYGPTRKFCSEVMARYGVEATFYDPRISPAALQALLRKNTKLVYLEAPGSLTFEMQDIPGLAAVAKAAGVLTAMDNTWATPLGFRPLEHGVDISIQAGTKYLAGHSDLVIGMITANDADLFRRIADHVMAFGDVAGPDDCYLTLRGMRTLGVRLARQQASALSVAGWLREQAAVHAVLYPALPGDNGYDLYQRDFTMGASLFGLALKTPDLDAVRRMVNGLEYFHLGSSWGGYESLIAVNLMPLPRDQIPWEETSYLLRLHVGLEDPDDLIADLAQGLARL